MLATPIEIGVSFQDQALVLALTELGSIPTASLRQVLGSLREQEDAIRWAIGRLFTGF